MIDLPTNGQSMDTYEVTRRAKKSGFESFSEFPQGRGQVGKLLGLGVCLHHSRNLSPAIAQWLQQVWKPKVAAITTFASNFKDIYSEPLFWANITSYVHRIAVDLGVPLPSEVDTRDVGLRKLCAHLCFDLFVLREQEGVWEMESVRTEKVGLPIVIGREDGKWLFLYHQSLYGSADSDFPLYFQPPKSPFLFPGFQAPAQSWAEVAEISHKMVDTVLTYTLQLCQKDFQPAFSDSLAELHRACAEYAAYSVTVGLPVWESLERWGKWQEYSDESHPVSQCERYRLVDAYVQLPACQHRFHESCLLGNFRTQSPESRFCPVCTAPVPFSFLQISAESPPEPVSPAYDWCYCRACATAVSYRQVITHQAQDSHSICVHCLYGKRICPVCGLELQTYEVVWVQQAAELLAARSPS